MDQWSVVRKIEVEKIQPKIPILSDQSCVDDVVKLRKRPEIQNTEWTEIQQKTALKKRISVKMDKSQKFQDKIRPVDTFYGVVVNQTDQFYLQEIRLHL